jgi:hypothetical protein
VTPLEELTKPTRLGVFVNLSSTIDSYKNIVFAVGGVLLVVLLLVVYSIFSSTDIDIEDNNSIADIKQEYQEDNPKDDFNKIINLKLNKNREFTLVNRNEAVQFLVDSKEVMFVLRDLKQDGVIIQTLPDKKYETLKINTPVALNVAAITREISLTLKGLTENSAKIMVELGKSAQNVSQESQKVVKAPERNKTADTTSVVAQNKENLKIIFEAEFVGTTYIDLYLDGQQKTKGLVLAGRRETWEASEFIQIKIGNAGGLKARINGKKYTFGKPGQVANKVITWKKDIKNPNLYHLVVKESK